VNPRVLDGASLFSRLALAASFLSAVADRFGAWGPPGAPNVAWGDFQHFTGYTAILNPLVPASLVSLVAWLATLAELGLGLLLAVGLYTRRAALLSSALLGVFALSMSFTIGVKGPLNYSVFSAAAAALLVFVVGPGRWALDARRHAADADSAGPSRG
jgi:uncharacterized membrane protein YphA (DoxX/SURF4 family)